MNNQWRSFISNLKQMSVLEEFIIHLSTKKILDAITAWHACFIRIDDLDLDYDSVENKIEYVWGNTIFDEKEMIIRFGFQAHETVARLAIANVIYPDGTYNKTFIEKLLKAQDGAEEYN